MNELITDTAIRLVLQERLIETVFQLLLAFIGLYFSQARYVHIIYGVEYIFKELRVTCVNVHLFGVVVTNFVANRRSKLRVFL